MKRKTSRKVTVHTAAVVAMAAGRLLATSVAPANASTLPEGNAANAVFNREAVEAANAVRYGLGSTVFS